MILYPLSGYSSYCIWKTGAILPLVPYAFSVVFNNLWTPLFFSENMYFGLAFIDLIFLWCSLFISFLSFLPISEFAAYALLPYLAWVTFAGVLNFSIWQNNSSKSPPKTASADANGKKSN